jgi:hypothetical protein
MAQALPKTLAHQGDGYQRAGGARIAPLTPNSGGGSVESEARRGHKVFDRVAP